MTISYPDSFFKSLILWKGSLWKAVLFDMLGWYAAYYAIMVGTYFGLKEDDQIMKWHRVIDYFERGTSYIPLTFLLGFFVAAVLSRWWAQFNNISFPDNLMLAVNAGLPGDENLAIRRTVARWVNLQAALAWRLLSVRTKARFPTLDHLVEAKLMTKQEKLMFDAVDSPFGKWFVPTVWCSNLFEKLHQEKKIPTTLHYKHMQTELQAYKGGFGMLMVYDWIVIPLVYVQVVAIATYGFFAFCLVARQPKFYSDTMDDSKQVFTLGFPLFTTLQMLFYLGWLKVAQFLMHPFGDDDDDFELNWILDRNVSIAYLLADPWSQQIPDHDVDPFMGQRMVRLPHTRASIKIRDIAPADNLADVLFKQKHLAVVSVDEAEHLFAEEEGRHAFQSLVRSMSMKKRNHHDTPEAASLNDKVEESLSEVEASKADGH